MYHDLFSSAAADEATGRSGSVGKPGSPGAAAGPDPSSDGAVPPAHSVSAVNALAREMLEGGIPPLWVAGEVTGWKRYPSGHCYFSLRDASAQIRCVMFRSDASRLPTDPEDGMEVRAFGSLSIYERRGDFQLLVRRLEGSGQDGLWRLAFERLRARLDVEGLLAPERKRPLPRCPARLGIVTSAAGAALHDILRVLEQRAPWTRVLFCPARVQGAGAAEEIARAVERLGGSGAVDVLIVGRGGGSVEDLWAFNEEAVARAIAACPVPVISAVGHETDVSIADLVADLRAPTPSAAAERAVPDRAVLGRGLDEWSARTTAALRRRLADPQRRLDSGMDRLVGAAGAVLRRYEERLTRAAGRLEALSPLAALRRGYAVPQDAGGRILRRVSHFERGAMVHLRVLDGSVDCRIEDLREEANNG